jgi:type VI secretion system secreted protein Hcp
MAAVDYFLKVDGIDGESGDAKYKDHIQIESWSWGETQGGAHAAGGGGGAGKVVMQDFHFVMKVNKASPKLMLACATGQHIAKGTLICRKAGGTQQDFLVVTMSDLLVSSFQTGGSGGSDVLPIDTCSMNFSKIEIEYKTQDAKGNVGKPVKVGYDVKANKKI